MISLFVQGSAPPAIEEYGVWGLNPTGGGIKSRKELSGGEFRSAEEGPKVPRGFGGAPNKLETDFHPRNVDSNHNNKSLQTSSQNRGSTKVSNLKKKLTKIAIFVFSSKK